MQEITGNLWDYYNHDHILCITTNGTVTTRGLGVMGRGCAAEAVCKIPGIARVLGRILTATGNHVNFLTDKPLPVVLSFPVKHNWWEPADLELIQRSAQELLTLWQAGWTHKDVIIPRPGCGNGKRKWSEVKPLLEFLPDNFKVISHA